ncbi:phosphate acyltransferase [Dunaliella salina]|uniref:Tafazzin family protein n=1 Tax=Dunaliella salina TaxID=3046 RepID=A0ABQ7GZ42_DUNSA|nr:phosphate acyltransferase [Dunaliella salina]KAF5839884.1 phosphate acyltransferase [Dunaliella salina]|eukprot:KAF5839883.1 phosphate acyltransferase [Dunaliella salina]
MASFLLTSCTLLPGRSITLGLVSGFAKLTLTLLNKFEVVNYEQFRQALDHRPRDTGLITIANHVSMFDDPGIPSALTPWARFWLDPWEDRVRWTLCAREVCFKNEFLRQFFAAGKTLPVLRGEGVQQPILRVVAWAAARGDWVHLFPEGKIQLDGKLGAFRWGVGKMVCDARLAGGKDPIILPMYHSGMSRVLPFKAFIFRVGHTISVRIGEPLDLSDITCDCNKPGKDQQRVWEAIALRMHAAMKELEDQSPPNISQRKPAKDQSSVGSDQSS